MLHTHITSQNKDVRDKFQKSSRNQTFVFGLFWVLTKSEVAKNPLSSKHLNIYKKMSSQNGTQDFLQTISWDQGWIFWIWKRTVHYPFSEAESKYLAAASSQGIQQFHLSVFHQSSFRPFHGTPRSLKKTKKHSLAVIHQAFCPRIF